jgi:hypothetical protein
MLNGRDEYPNTILAALLETMEQRGGDNTTLHVPDGSGVAFATTSSANNLAANNGGNTTSDAQQTRDAAGRHAHIQCFACGQVGHYANQCPSRNGHGATLAQCVTDIPKT